MSLTGSTAIFGPSGSGKTTLLRLIAGFERPDSGSLKRGTSVWCDVATKQFIPPHRRGVGTVFQDMRLFPHLSVYGNLQYADKRSGNLASRHTLNEIVDILDLAPLLNRNPEQLSGGERQRVALARTLLTRPDLLVLDEPLSALDRQRRREILPYLEGLPKTFGIPVVYVSHNVEEVLRLADQTWVLRDGKLEHAGPTLQTLNTFLADTDQLTHEPMAILSAKIASVDERYSLITVDIGEGSISLPYDSTKTLGDRVYVRVDARNVAIATCQPKGLSIRNILAATIISMDAAPASHATARMTTPFVIVSLRVADFILYAQITRAAVHDLGLKDGMAVFALIKSASFNL